MTDNKNREDEKMAEKENGFMSIIKDGLSFVSQIVSASIVSPIADGAEIVMKNIDERIMRVEKRILRKLTSFIIIGCGALFLILALFFFLIDYLRWSKAIAFVSIGIIIFVIGLILKLRESDN